jgi:hypothetical protein
MTVALLEINDLRTHFDSINYDVEEGETKPSL